MTERDLIDTLTRGLPRAPEQVNATHESDAEILRLGDDLWAVTVDDFSAEEDLFHDANPWLVGWNVVTATLSDLLSVGAIPRFFLPSVCLPPRCPEDFLHGITRGVGDALGSAGCFLIGGDVGRAPQWRYTGTAFGPIVSSRPLTRKIPDGHHSLWVSGPMGGANAAAARGAPPPRFPLHLEIATAIRDLASACTDTSGGFYDAVWNLGSATHSSRMEIDTQAIPLAPEVPEFAAATGIPWQAALLGGAGEYELLFAVPDPMPEGATERLLVLGCTMVGRVTVPEKGPGIFLRRGDGEKVPMPEPPPCPRASDSTEGHIREVAAMARTLFGGEST